LYGLAAVAVRRGAPELAARLLAAASATQAGREPLAYGLRTPYQEILDAAKAALGDTAFAAAWAGGRALPPDQALALALDDRQQP